MKFDSTCVLCLFLGNVLVLDPVVLADTNNNCLLLSTAIAACRDGTQSNLTHPQSLLEEATTPRRVLVISALATGS